MELSWALAQDLALICIIGGLALVAFVFIVLVLIGAVYYVLDYVRTGRKKWRRKHRSSPGPRHTR